MSATRVLLSIEPKLSHELVRSSLEQHPEVLLVGECWNHLECLALMAERKPHIWIHSWDEGADLQALLTHVRDILPEIVIVRLDNHEAYGSLQMPIKSLPQLIALTRTTHDCLTPT